MTYKKKPAYSHILPGFFGKKNMQTCETWLKLSQVTSARSLAQGDATRRATVRAFDVHLSGSTAYAQVCHVFFLMVVMWFKHKLAANNMLAKRESGVRLRWNMYTYFMYSYIYVVYIWNCTCKRNYLGNLRNVEVIWIMLGCRSSSRKQQ